MPGPPRWREPRLVTHMLSSRKLLPDTLTERAEGVVRFVQRLAQMSPEVVYGDGIERSREPDERIKSFGRRVAREGIVLLRNEGGVLPIEKKSGGVKKIAVIGPNAKGRVISGGGSAYLKATYVVSPWEGISAAAKERGIEVAHSVGCYGTSPFPPSVRPDSISLSNDSPTQHTSTSRHWKTASSLRLASQAGSARSTLRDLPSSRAHPDPPAPRRPLTPLARALAHYQSHAPARAHELQDHSPPMSLSTRPSRKNLLNPSYPSTNQQIKNSTMTRTRRKTQTKRSRSPRTF